MKRTQATAAGAAAEPAWRALGQVVERHRGTVGQHDRPLDDVLQLADVARPVVGHQGLDGLGVQVRDRLAGALGVDVQEVDRQLEDVLAPLAQARACAGRSR